MRGTAQKRSLALDHAAGRLTDDEYLGAVKALRRIRQPERAPATVGPDKAIALLRDYRALWAEATDEERARLIAATYDRITVRGPEFVAARLTPSAYAHGLALALPERVRVPMLAGRGRPQRVGQVSPEGLEPSTR
jgi:hypothetical protein